MTWFVSAWRTALGRLGRFLAGAAILALTSACASTGGAVPRPFPTPGGDARSRPADAPGREERSASVSSNSITQTALALRGTPYRNGGTDRAGFDCSGFTQYVFARNGIVLPRDVKEQAHAGRAVKSEALVPGDLIFFSTVAPGPSHVGIALGGGEFVHAPSSSGVVRVERVDAAYWSRRFVGARRVS